MIIKSEVLPVIRRYCIILLVERTVRDLGWNRFGRHPSEMQPALVDRKV